MSLITVFAIVFAVVVVLLVLNRAAVGTMWFNLRSALGAGAKSVDSRYAVNNMHQAVEDAKAEISKHTAKLNRSQGQINSLTRQTQDSNREVAVLTSRVQARAVEVRGDTNDKILLDLADQLGKAQLRATEATTELTAQTGLHNQVLEQVKSAVLQADRLEKDAERMGVKLDLSASRAELASVGIDFAKSSAHGKLSAAEGYQKQIQSQIDTNNGAVEVAMQLNPGAKSTATTQWNQEQDAKATLAKLGIGKTE